MIPVGNVPRFIILQSMINETYLHFNNPDVGSPLSLVFNGDYSYGLETRFEVVPATKGKPATVGNQLVHLRSVHNNKFWEKISNSDWISATAEKTDENPESPGCTLFETRFFPNTYTVEVTHKNTGYRVVGSYTETMYGGLTLAPVPETVEEIWRFIFVVVDWQSVPVFPDRIRIKADNEEYLKASSNGDLFFQHASYSPEFEFQVSPSRNGGIRLKSVKHGKYLEKDHTDLWVSANWDSSSYGYTDHPSNTVFIAINRDDGKIALKNLRNGCFCKRYTYKHKNWLATENQYQDDWSALTIEEPYVTRKIDNLKYNFKDARRYEETTSELITDDATNITSNPLTSKLNLKTTVTNTKKFSRGVTVAVGGRMSFSAGIPFTNNKGEFEIHTEVTGSWNWGEDNTETQEVGSEKSIDVRPKTRVKASLIATRLSYDIPYSYTQTDKMADGTVKVREMNDGLFTGKNGYGYRYVVEELPIE